jgi:urease accessory protein
MDNPSQAFDEGMEEEAPVTQRDPTAAAPISEFPASEITESGLPPSRAIASSARRTLESDAPTLPRDFAARAFTVGIGGTVGSGKTALVLAICRALRGRESLAVLTNDLGACDDAEYLREAGALPAEAIAGVQLGERSDPGEDVGANLEALDRLMNTVRPELLLIESKGDDRSACFSADLADFTIYVLDVAGGERCARKGGPGPTRANLLVVNKTDLAPHVGADLAVLERDARALRAELPVVLAQCNAGVGVDAVVAQILEARRAAREETRTT